MSHESGGSTPNSEVVALFRSAEGLLSAADALELVGIDRGRLSVLAPGAREGEALKSAGFTTIRDVLKTANLEGLANVRPDDVAATCAAPISESIYVAASLIRAGATEMTGAILPPIVAAAAASAKTEGSPHAFLLFRLLDKPEPHVEESLARGGLVLWVLLSDSALEVTPALHQAGGEFLRVQYIPFDRALSAR